ncbi:DUF4082 domain-containing protein [Embleya sp. MST-111070]|uniref:DUF4082 domain-containing protein n=1 Tax=Embleya sp. MST-111070 TaxID=3398231 RepID=UPI003F731DE8
MRSTNSMKAACARTRPGLRQRRGTWASITFAAIGALLFTLFAPITAAQAAPCSPCSLFAGATPGGAVTDTDAVAVELGVRFKPAQDGTITQVKFWKDAANTGTHTGRIWNTATGTATSVTFTGESTSGWQSATFAAPIPVTAGTEYIASYVAPVGRYTVTADYFATDRTVEQLLAPASNGTQGNGVYTYNPGGGMPTDSYRAGNYWVDVSFVPGADTTPPTATQTVPAANATGVATAAPLSVTFSEPVQPATVQWAVTRTGGPAVPGAASYNGNTATFTPTSALAASTGYTVSVSGAKDAAGNTAATKSWSFTTGNGSTQNIETSIWTGPVSPTTPNQTDNNSVEVGVKFRTTADGQIKSIRFWKLAGSTGPYAVSLWDKNTQTRLATVPNVNRTGTGWQTVDLPTPITVHAGVTYVASYFAPNGNYPANTASFSQAVGNTMISALADGVDGGNGVYKYNAGSIYPTDSWNGSNYWVDVVFSTNAEDTVAPAITDQSPTPNANGVLAGVQPSVTFSEPLKTTGLTFELKRNGTVVPAELEFDNPTNPTQLTLKPNAELAYGTPYTLTVGGVKDRSDNAMPDANWAFTTGQAPPTPPCDAPNTGPILVIKADSNPFSCYYTEILRAEGLNSFAVKDASTVTATVLNGYTTVVLGDFAPSAQLVADLTTWVNAGGNLIAMHPRAALAGLLGLGTSGGFQANQYMKVDSGTAPGAGIYSQLSMQYHGPADVWTVPGGVGTIRVADLYTRTGTSPLGPAVTTRTVGSGTASAFTYDLARSIVQTRQGNPAQAGVENDNFSDSGGPLMRADDMFYPDWIDLSRVRVPQADEQQRLFANLIEIGNRAKAPIPRTWYLPGNAATAAPDLLKVVMVSTGDNHGQNLSDMQGRVTRYNNNSSDPNCSSPIAALRDAAVRNWKCMRGTIYVWGPGPQGTQAPPVSDVQSWTAQGFEIARHVDENGSCPQLRAGASQTDINAELSAVYENSLDDFTRYAPLKPTTNRTHCLIWPDWSSNATIARAKGIRLDTNYYYMPDYWKNTWGGSLMKASPGFFTGSGFPMRFTDPSGQMIDIYQGTTQINDEFQQVYPDTFDQLVSGANNDGFYGAFVMNNHTDSANANGGVGNVGQLDIEAALIASAKAKNVPIVSAKQLLDWTDARNASTVTGLNRVGNTVTFTVNQNAAATNLMTMLPTTGSGGTTLTGLSRGGAPVTFQKTTIKGIEYAVFDGTSGAYTATYATPVAPLIARAEAAPAPDGSGTLTWTTDVPATTEMQLGTQPDQLPITQQNVETAGEHKVALGALKPDTTYYYRLTSVNAKGDRTTWPAPNTKPAEFRTPKADRKAPVISDVAVKTWPDGSADLTWKTDKPTTTSVLLGDTAAAMRPVYTDAKQRTTTHHAKLGHLGAGATYAFRLAGIDAAGNEGTWTGGGGKKKDTARLVMPRPGVAETGAFDFTNGTVSGGAVSGDRPDALTLDRARTGTYVSKALDAGQMVTWLASDWQADIPKGTTLRVSVRTGTTAIPDASWTPWKDLAKPGDTVGTSSRFLQYKVELTGDGTAMPTLKGIGFTHDGKVTSTAPVTEAGPNTAPGPNTRPGKGR